MISDLKIDFESDFQFDFESDFQFDFESENVSRETQARRRRNLITKAHLWAENCTTAI